MSGARPRRKSGTHARRPGKPLRRRIRRPRLRGGGRILALLLFTATIAGLVAGVYGPWMRVTALGHTGDAYTPAGSVQEILDDYRGVPILAVDRAALRDRLAALPTVADARVELRLPGELQVAITEKPPAFLWRTQRAVLVGARDGTIITELPLTGALPDGLRRLPSVEDERFVSRLLVGGGRRAPGRAAGGEAPDGARPQAHRLAGHGARRQGRLPEGLRAGVACSPPGRRRWASTSSIPARTRQPPTRGWSSSWRPSGPCSPPGRSATSRGWMPATRGRYIGRPRARDGTDHGPSGVHRNRR